MASCIWGLDTIATTIWSVVSSAAAAHPVSVKPVSTATAAAGHHAEQRVPCRPRRGGWPEAQGGSVNRRLMIFLVLGARDAREESPVEPQNLI